MRQRWREGKKGKKEGGKEGKAIVRDETETGVKGERKSSEERKWRERRRKERI